MKHAQKGFTLIEIMIVVAIIAILAAVAIPNFISYRKTAQKNSCLSTQDTIATAAEAYLVAHPGATTVAITDLYKTDGTGYLKTKTEPLCPDGSSKYTITITDGIVSITCSNGETDADYKHSKATTTPTPTPAG